MPLAARAAQTYIAGPTLGGALRVATGLAEQGFATTLGFWDGADDTPGSVCAEYLAALDALGRKNHDSYLSIKLPALGHSSALLQHVTERARSAVAGAERGSDVPTMTASRFAGKLLASHGETHPLESASAVALADIDEATTERTVRPLRIHFDSLAPEAADAMWSAAVEAAEGGANVSCSLPGRWRRSLEDADAAVEAGIVPRVVKGQWPDADDPQADLRIGFMQVITRLAGRAPHVAVASHDVPLAQKAIERLRASGTTCELELLYGLPQRASLALAARENVPVRFYVPYGKAYLPYCLGQARRRPQLLWWLLRDALLRC